MNIFDRYVTSAPSAQNALDIFADAWVSKLPPPLDALQAGAVPLFDMISISSCWKPKCGAKTNISQS
jgi:hypothetical protein